MTIWERHRRLPGLLDGPNMILGHPGLDSDSDWSPGMEEEDEIERALEFQKFLQNLL